MGRFDELAGLAEGYKSKTATVPGGKALLHTVVSKAGDAKIVWANFKVPADAKAFASTKLAQLKKSGGAKWPGKVMIEGQDSSPSGDEGALDEAAPGPGLARLKFNKKLAKKRKGVAAAAGIYSFPSRGDADGFINDLRKHYPGLPTRAETKTIDGKMRFVIRFDEFREDEDESAESALAEGSIASQYADGYSFHVDDLSIGFGPYAIGKDRDHFGLSLKQGMGASSFAVMPKQTKALAAGLKKLAAYIAKAKLGEDDETGAAALTEGAAEMTNWKRIKKVTAHGDSYLFVSMARVDNPKEWLPKFRAQAKQHGLRVKVEKGHVYVFEGESEAGESALAEVTQSGPAWTKFWHHVEKTRPKGKFDPDWIRDEEWWDGYFDHNKAAAEKALKLQSAARKSTPKLYGRREDTHHRFDALLEDAQDAADLEAALADPANAEPVSFEEAMLAEGCATPGMKLRSKGKGKGLAKGDGKGPIGEPYDDEAADEPADPMDEWERTVTPAEPMVEDKDVAKAQKELNHLLQMLRTLALKHTKTLPWASDYASDYQDAARDAKRALQTMVKKLAMLH